MARTMTEAELRDFVVTRWRYGRDVRFIVVEAVCLGAPLTRKRVQAIIRAYVDETSENKQIRAGRSPGFQKG